jgi:hypothetical protein
MILLGNSWLWPALTLAASLVAIVALAVNRRLAHRLPESQKGQEGQEKSWKVLEEEKRVLELVARGASLQEVLDALTQAIERMAPDCFCTILLLDKRRPQVVEGIKRKPGGRVHGSRQRAGNRPERERLRHRRLPK